MGANETPKHEHRSSKDEKWTMFKNFMHHELGVSKEDIRGWIREAVVEQAARLVNQEFSEFNMRRIIQEQISQSRFGGTELKAEARKVLIEVLTEKLDIEIKVNNK